MPEPELTLYLGNANRVEKAIRPPLEAAITLPVFEDGLPSSVSIYVAASPFSMEPYAEKVKLVKRVVRHLELLRLVTLVDPSTIDRPAPRDICPSRDDAQPHIYEDGRCTMCLAPRRKP